MKVNIKMIRLKIKSLSIKTWSKLMIKMRTPHQKKRNNYAKFTATHMIRLWKRNVSWFNWSMILKRLLWAIYPNQTYFKIMRTIPLSLLIRNQKAWMTLIANRRINKTIVNPTHHHKVARPSFLVLIIFEILKR